MAKKETRLFCPQCVSTVAWNGVQFVCTKCPWTEHKENPPSSHKIELPKEFRDRKSNVAELGQTKKH